MLNPPIIPRRLAPLSAAAALLLALAPAFAQDESASPAATPADSAPAELLPAPDQKPISHVVRSGERALESQTPPESTTDATFAAVPTTPIQSNDLPSGAADESLGSGSAEGEEKIIPDRPIGSDTTASTAGSSEPLVPATSDQPAANTTAAVEGAPPPPAETEPSPTAEPAAGTAESSPPAKQQSDESEAVEQTAAAPIDGMIRIVYASEASGVTDPAKELLAPLVAKLTEDYSLRVKVLAYAAGDEDQSTHARGISLARALAMREYLVEQGIAMDRLDMRALGNSAQEEPADRVDLIAVPE